MTYHRALMPLLGGCLIAASSLQAQATPDGDLSDIKKQMLQMRADLRQMQQQHQKEIDALKSKIQAQEQTIEELKKTATVTVPPSSAKLPEGSPAPAEPTLFPTTDDSVVMSPTQPTTSPPAPTSAFPTSDASVTAAGPSPAPLTIAGGGKSFLNISFDAMFVAAGSSAADLSRLSVGDHDPQRRGFNARNNEIALSGAVDPFFEAFANIVYKLDAANETSVEVEEAFLQTTTLPWSLQLKGGQFFAPFGRINPTHPHTWDFINAPLVHGRLLGPDGLRGIGVQASWVAPVPWYSQFLLAVQNGEGGTASSFRNRGEDGTFFGRQTLDRQPTGLGDFLFVPRWENSIDLTPTQTVLAGVSAAFGPNDTGASARTQIYGVDLFYKWKPADAEGGWPFVKWQTEAMWRRYEAGRGLDDSFPRAETLKDWGVYSQVVWGFKKGWAAGIRGDYLHEDASPITNDPDRQSRYRLSADLTFYPSEFSKIRLQYDHDFLKATPFQDSGSEDTVMLLFEFTLGAHGAHKY